MEENKCHYVKMKMEKNCVLCNKIFYYSHDKPIRMWHWENKKYCSKECGDKVNTEKSRNRNRDKNKISLDWNKERICLICDNKFIPKTKNQIFCSKECSKKSTDFDYVHKNLLELNRKGLNINWLKIRILIFDRDKFTCKYCGRSPMKDNNVILHVDHKIPKQKNGTNDISNLITSCEQCNLGKKDLLLTYWKKK